MSIVQNLKLLNKPISELAMLPQETIMAMAQAGQIPVQFVAPILGEKAQQAQAGANVAAMAAQQQMPPGSVLEGILAQNAANEVKAQMPEDMGIGTLPVSEDMVPEFAGGGIVAFKNRGFVDSFDYGAASRDIDEASGVGSLDSPELDELGKKIKLREELRKRYLGENEAIRTEREGMEEAARQQRAMRLLEAGLGIMGGESPYAMANIAKGAQPALRGYGEDLAAQRKRKSELAGMERAEKSKILEGVLSEEAAQAKTSNARERVSSYVAAQQELIKAGKRPAASAAQLTNEGWTRYAEEAGMAGPRAQTQAYGAGVTAADYARKVREDNKRDYSLAQREITRDTSPELAKRIKDAQAKVQQLEAEINRVTGFMGGGQSAPAGSGGGGGRTVDFSSLPR